jgi:hypothetical protein
MQHPAPARKIGSRWDRSGRSLGIRPDLVVEVRRDVLEETDGPMLKYGLQRIA